MEHTSLFPGALADYAVSVLNLAGVDVVDVFVAVVLTDPLRRAVILDCHFGAGRFGLTYSQRRLVRIASHDGTLPPGLFRHLLFGRSLLPEHRCRQRKGK